jgi:hypothetical protein
MKLLTSDFNCETGELIEREMTKAEADQYKLDSAERETQILNETKKQNDKAALLTKLGITADEAALLLS